MTKHVLQLSALNFCSVLCVLECSWRNKELFQSAWKRQMVEICCKDQILQSSANLICLTEGQESWLHRDFDILQILVLELHARHVKLYLVRTMKYATHFIQIEDGAIWDKVHFRVGFSKVPPGCRQFMNAFFVFAMKKFIIFVVVPARKYFIRLWCRSAAASQVCSSIGYNIYEVMQWENDQVLQKEIQVRGTLRWYAYWVNQCLLKLTNFGFSWLICQLLFWPCLFLYVYTQL